MRPFMRALLATVPVLLYSMMFTEYSLFTIKKAQVIHGRIVRLSLSEHAAKRTIGQMMFDGECLAAILSTPGTVCGLSLK